MPSGHVRVGYYIWRFPDLTGTYIQREVGALRQAGLDLEVLADLRERDALLDADARALVSGTHYLLPIDAERLRAYRQRLLRDDPPNAAPQDLRLIDHAVYLAGHVRERGITHLHSPWAHLAGFIASLAARLAGVPYSVQARASTDLYRNGSRVGLAEILAQAKFIVTGSAFNRSFIEQVAPQCMPLPIEVIYEGLDPTRFAPGRRRQAASDPLRILSVGRLSEEKGFEHLLHALAALRACGRRFRCVIVGGVGPGSSDRYARALADLCRRLELDDDVCFAGALPFDCVLEEYARADVFAMSSVVASDGGRDVTPNVLIEAMATQLAVVAPKMTAIPEIVEDRASGILVPPRNPAALAQAVCELADDPALAHRLGQNARRRVEERFDVRKNVRRYLELFTGRKGPVRREPD